MNDFVIVLAGITTGLFICSILVLSFILRKKKSDFPVRNILIPGISLGVLSFLAIFFWIRYLDNNMSPLDKHSVGYQGDEIERMTDFSSNRLATRFRLISFVEGKNYVISIDEVRQEKAFMPEGQLNLALEDALKVLREDKPYIVTDIQYIFEEHSRQPYYNFEVAFHKDLLISINGITGQKQEIQF